MGVLLTTNRNIFCLLPSSGLRRSFPQLVIRMEIEWLAIETDREWVCQWKSSFTNEDVHLIRGFAQVRSCGDHLNNPIEELWALSANDTCLRNITVFTRKWTLDRLDEREDKVTLRLTYFFCCCTSQHSNMLSQPARRGESFPTHLCPCKSVLHGARLYSREHYVKL